MEDADRFRAESRRSWGAVAEAWGGVGARQVEQALPVAMWMVEAARLQPGHDVLELAAGTGEVGFLAYELIQPGGTLLTSDFSPEMLTQAQRSAERRGLQGVRFKQIDAESIDLAAASMDAVLCRWGFMLMADPGAALRECRRVLRPGGRLALAAWGRAEDNRWSSVVSEVLVERGLAEPTPPGTPSQFAWGEPGVIEAALEDAGFVDEIEVEALDFAYRETFEAWWSRTLEMSRSGRLIAGMAGAERDAIREDLRARLAGHDAGDGTLVLPASTWVAAATA